MIRFFKDQFIYYLKYIQVFNINVLYKCVYSNLNCADNYRSVEVAFLHPFKVHVLKNQVQSRMPPRTGLIDKSIERLSRKTCYKLTQIRNKFQSDICSSYTNLHAYYIEQGRLNVLNKVFLNNSDIHSDMKIVRVHIDFFYNVYIDTEFLKTCI